METQVTFRIPRAMHARVQAAAGRLGLKRSQVVRMALQDFLGRMEQGEGASPFDRVQDLAGSVRSGLPDLGTRHRERIQELTRQDERA